MDLAVSEKCQECGKSFGPASLRKHASSCGRMKVPKFDKTTHYLRGTDGASYLKLIKLHPPRDVAKYSKLGAAARRTRPQCDICGRKFNFMDTLSKHSRSCRASSETSRRSELKAVTLEAPEGTKSNVAGSHRASPTLRAGKKAKSPAARSPAKEHVTAGAARSHHPTPMPGCDGGGLHASLRNRRPKAGAGTTGGTEVPSHARSSAKIPMRLSEPSLGEVLPGECAELLDSATLEVYASRNPIPSKSERGSHNPGELDSYPWGRLPEEEYGAEDIKPDSRFGIDVESILFGGADQRAAPPVGVHPLAACLPANFVPLLGRLSRASNTLTSPTEERKPTTAPLAPLLSSRLIPRPRRANSRATGRTAGTHRVASMSNGYR